MNLSPAELLDPIFNALEGLIENDGVYLYLVFVWLALGSLPWYWEAVCGNGERKLRHNHSRHHLHDATANAMPADDHRQPRMTGLS